MKLLGRALTGVVVGLFLLSGPCNAGFSAATKTIKIGFALSMTGGAAVYGASQKEGILLAVDQINAASGGCGLQIVPVFEDDASVPSAGDQRIQQAH